MRQVKNPFGLEIHNPAAASVTRGVTLTPDCLEDCVLTCYWGCNVQKLHEALQKHVYCFRIKTPQALEDALYNEYLYKQQYLQSIKKNDKAEKYCQLAEDAQVVDFGPVPRARYPLVALLTLADEEDREIYDIYLLLAQGQYHDLKQLFMSANSPTPSCSDPGECSTDRGLLEKAGLAGDEPELQEENSKDCVVCQNGPVNWVLLPCRHTCLCDGCIRYFQQCPMCRQFVQESFPLCSKKEQDEDESTRVLQDVLPGRLPYFSSLHMLTGALLPRAMWTGEVRGIALKDLKAGLWQELGVEGGAQDTVSDWFGGFVCEGLQPKPFGKIFVDDS
ncbi:hypothetical protein EK904_004815 [Melospiza melodia maxima]|nr:hypothetical protein EK904_004815 [Melospiza melodia maxima]